MKEAGGEDDIRLHEGIYSQLIGMST